MANIPMTPLGVEILKKRLQHLREVERPQNVRDIEEALAHGDLRENAEFHAAKDRQGQIEGMMQHTKELLASAEIIDPSKLSGARVVFGATVTVVDCDDEDAEPIRYQIVGEHESDLEAGRISYTSPLARALIGKEEGDEVVIRAPSGNRNVCIEAVEFI